jgi:hypothetical protein
MCAKDDRDQGDDWLAHDNFGDFYAATKHLFFVSFSRPELLQAAVIKGFVHKQMGAMVRRLPAADGLDFERLDSMLTQLVAANFEKLRAILVNTWPAEYADMVERNSRPKVFF